MCKMPSRLQLAARLLLRFYKVSGDTTWLYATFHNSEIPGKPLRAFVCYHHPRSAFRSRSFAKSKNGKAPRKSTATELKDISLSSIPHPDATLSNPPTS